MSERVLGVDGCRGGWVGVVLDGIHARVFTGRTIAEVVAWAGGIRVVGIDIPIGLPDAGTRRSDALARAELGARRSTIFVTPVRAALDQHVHADAVRVNRELAGTGISIQAFNLAPKILEVDQWVRTTALRVAEAHPEMSFARMAGAPLVATKKTAEGIAVRRDLLGAHGIRVPPKDLAAHRPAMADDVLDAAAVAWTARRISDGVATCLPDPPETFTDGLAAAIWT